MKPKGLLSSLGTGLLLAAVVLGWIFLAPRPLGGPVSYVVTDGISMRPRLTEGDLVIVREAEEYRVGDVVAYDSHLLQRVVLHRIVDTEGDHYLFQGDNNDFIDQDRPTQDDFLGKEWVVLPGVGKALGWVGDPLNAAIVAGLATLLILGGAWGFGKRSRDAAPSSSGDARATRGSVSAFTPYLAGATTLCLIGTALLFALPEERQRTREVTYESTGSFTYSGETERSPVYPNGRVRTGDAVFMNLVDELEVAFDYSFATRAEHEVAGTAELRAELSDGSGWHRALGQLDTAAIEDDGTVLAGTIDLADLRKLIARVQELTGVALPSYTLSLESSVEITGATAGRAIDEAFTPELRFQVDHLKLSVPEAPAPGPGEQTIDPLRPTQPGSVEVAFSERNVVGVGPLQVPVGPGRMVLAAAALLSLLLLIASLLGRRDVEEPVAIQRAYGAWMVDVASTRATAERKAIEMRSMEGLAQLADRYNRAILHDVHEGIHSYVVEEEGIAYWYQAFESTARPPRAANVSPLPAPLPGGVVGPQRRAYSGQRDG